MGLQNMYQVADQSSGGWLAEKESIVVRGFGCRFKV
jgi:hypothetical protein